MLITYYCRNTICHNSTIGKKTLRLKMRNENKHSKYKDRKKCNNYPKFINTAGNFVQKKLQLTVIVITWFLYGKH